MQLNKNYWENRYLTNVIEWDVGTITTPLKEYIDQLTDKTLRILIPGAGNGYEVDYLINQGFTNVFVIDLAAIPLQNIQKRNPTLPKENLIQKDFFELENKFDLILEQTFFCALHPELREKYAQKMHSLLKPNGKIAGLLFDFPLTETGPPFGGSKDEYLNLFSEKFKIRQMETAYNSIKPRAGRELFLIFEAK